jgi:hypothetical protein
VGKESDQQVFHHCWFQLILILGCLGRFLGLFRPCIILVVIPFITHYGWRHRRLFLWLGLVVNRWVIRGGLLGGVKDQFLSLFWAAVDHVFWNHIAHVVG